MISKNKQKGAEIPATAPEFSCLVMESGETTFIIGFHFSYTSKDTLDDKVKKVIRKEVESGNF